MTEVSEILKHGIDMGWAMEIDPRDFARQSPGLDEKLPIGTKNRTNTYNDNNGIYNIYDEKGRMYITANAELVDKITSSHKDMKQDSSLGVAFSNGEDLVYANGTNPRPTMEWRNVRETGQAISKRFFEKKNEAEDARAAKLQQLNALRGIQKETPTKPAEKREVDSNVMNKMLDSKMRS